ncbi:hypothetical protein HPG69_018973 [Diceros bicornis minor]|uniref:Membrane-spanning 4-domains subfamily A member 15 n=1 Tax=Diceros bicornis minor TaxID=77932 RepID=A0A7J7FH45_DICBM|nr:hypothetical protein HPG69_018973 [Diceros bicornis minor]
MSAAPASNGVFVVIPPSNASGLRPPPPLLPAAMCQPPGMMQFEEPPLGAQTPRATQPPDPRPMETFLTGEPKALGVRTASVDNRCEAKRTRVYFRVADRSRGERRAGPRSPRRPAGGAVELAPPAWLSRRRSSQTVQILIGLIHLGFGSVLLMVRRGHVGMLFIEGGVPFWGGACFIISGSLSVAAEKNHISCLVRSSLGTNILSAMAAFAGTAILLMDFGVTSWDVGRGYLAVLTIFTVLEFFIAVVVTHFGCQATHAQANEPVVFLPNAFSTDFNIPSPAASPPPAYDNVAYMAKESSE